jgi:dihydrofolate synthase / folylpolyglutamate synthase
MAVMTYREALAWIYSFINTERTGDFVRDREDNLRRERTLLAALGNPHRAYGVTHVAGTKGKGSTSAMIASILHHAGLRVGLYTQPDLHTFRERIRVGDALIREDEVAALVPELQAAVAATQDAVGPFITYEIGTTLAFLYFQRAAVQHAVIEVGLGGRLDATNVVEPAVAVITSISYDHMHVLGDTLAAIAGEKAGIIKPGVPTVCSAQAPEALEVIQAISAERGAPLVVVGPEGAPSAAYTYRDAGATSEAQWLDVHTPTGTYLELELSLLGEHQLENATAAVAAVEQLRTSGLEVGEDAIRAGLREATWPARLQVVGERPWLVVDGAHNADSMMKLAAALRRHFRYRRLALVVGLLADKDLDRIAPAMVAAAPDLVVVTAANSPRSMPTERITEALRALDPNRRVLAEPECGAAIAAALREIGPDDLLCVTGSLYLAGEALRWFAAHGGAELMRPVEIAGVDH